MPIVNHFVERAANRGLPRDAAAAPTTRRQEAQIA